jgi:hypothetical protein
MKPKAYRERMKQIEDEKAAAEAADSAAPAGGFVPTASLASVPAFDGLASAAPLTPDPDEVLPGAQSDDPLPEGVEFSEEVSDLPEVIGPGHAEWCSHCGAPRLVDSKNAHWCGQCRRVPLKK